VSNRDDSLLYTGITSVSNEPHTPRQLQKESKRQARQKLKPAAEVVLELIAKEVKNVADIRSLIVDRKSTEQEVNTELVARKYYLGYLNSLEAKINRIVKESKDG